MNCVPYLQPHHSRLQLHPTFGLPVSMVFLVLVLPHIILMMHGIYKKKVISFRVLESPHTAEVIFQAIMSVLREYNLKTDLENKVSSVSFDNASNNIKAVEYLIRSLNPIMDGVVFHQKCACHILNLTVKSGLKTPEVDRLIKKFKESLTFIYSNNIRKQQFHSLCQRLNLSKLSVPWDVDTRWNSTYRMLARCLNYRDAIDEQLSSSPEGLTMMLSPSESNQLVHLMDFLEAFSRRRLSCLARIHQPRMSCFTTSYSSPKCMTK